MKKIKTYSILLAMLISIIFNWRTAYAEEITDYDSETISSESSAEDPELIDAKLISTETYKEGRKIITETVYEQSDGTIIIDKLTVGTNLLRSAKGTDSATRTRTIENFGTISITAKFSWYTEGAFSYVKCTSMSATKSANSGVICDKWDTSYTSEYVSLGKATAQVTYQFHRKDNPANFKKGTFKITCTDDGTISDGGW